MKQILISISALVLCGILFAAVPSVTNVTVTPGTGQVTISYDLSADGNNCQVIMLVSNDGGTSYNYFPTHTSGDIGNAVTKGTGKQITWYPAQDGMTIGSNYKIKLIARDNPSPSVQPVGFIKVNGGSFMLHRTDTDSVQITLSTFYLDRTEITQSEYLAVMGTNPSYFGGTDRFSLPVEKVSWFNAIEYCNRRSMQEHLTPCYSYSNYGTNPDNWPSGWNETDSTHTNVHCDWDANGYRLPTEMEWMFAARGGNLTHNYTYSGSDTVDVVAWYKDNSDKPQQVATKRANELGIYDMSGNVWEWVWDIYGDYPSEDQTNPHGANDGECRVLRGGSYYYDASLCEVSHRDCLWPTDAFDDFGFRVCRHSLQ
mgnify:CR=1 FL=1